MARSTDEALLDLPAAELAAAVRGGTVSARAVTELALRRIEARRGGNAFITTCPERALERADRSPGGPLAGVPFAAKDLFDTAGIRTTYGSDVFRDHVPTRTAVAVRRLEGAGAILVGKTNLHEFAWGVTSQNPHWGTVANPARPGRVAGGSSGGNAAALVERMCTVSLGTDTGGSVRIPAACCDVVGFKPHYGAVPVAGTFPLAPSFDTVGPMARSVRDCALVYEVLTGQAVPGPRISGLRVIVVERTGIEDDLAALGAVVEEGKLPQPIDDPTPVFLAECAYTHDRWFPAQRERYGRDLQVKLDAAGTVTALEYQRGIAALRDLQRRARTEPAADLVLTPTMPIEPPPDDCWEPDVRVAMTRNTRPFNFLGWPAIAIGNVQLAGRDDRLVLAAALALEEAGVGLR